MKILNIDLRRPLNDIDEISANLILARVKISRKQIDILFEELQNLGYGKFIKGKTGRGNVSKFIRNLNCPDEFEFKIKEAPTYNKSRLCWKY